jgi:hypothetical protein
LSEHGFVGLHHELGVDECCLPGLHEELGLDQLPERALIALATVRRAYRRFREVRLIRRRPGGRAPELSPVCTGSITFMLRAPVNPGAPAKAMT